MLLDVLLLFVMIGMAVGCVFAYHESCKPGTYTQECRIQIELDSGEWVNEEDGKVWCIQFSRDGEKWDDWFPEINDDTSYQWFRIGPKDHVDPDNVAIPRP